jgi:hypothetical protein
MGYVVRVKLRQALRARRNPIQDILEMRESTVRRVLLLLA